MSSKRVFTTEDLWALKRVGPTAVSPDGRWACAAVTRYDMEGNEGTTQLWLLSTDGKTQKQLTRGKRDGEPAWSPDGKWIAFVSKRGEGKEADETGQIYLIAADGGEARRLTNIATGAGGLRWFPDSSRIAFSSWVWPELETEKAQAKRLKADKDDKVKAIVLDRSLYRYWDHWFPRGREPHLHLVEVATGKTRDLFAGMKFRLSLADPGAGSYDISPDGKEVVFPYDFDPDPKIDAPDIVAMDLKSGKWTRFTDKKGHTDEAPRYSPDGKYIAFVSFDVTKSYNEQARLWLIERATGTLTALTQGWDRGVNAPLVWAADSGSLYFTAETEVAQPIWRIGIDETIPTELIRGPGFGGTAGDLRLGADGTTLVYSRASQSHPPTLFAAAIDGSGERSIERFNKKLLGELKFSQSQSVTVKGFDGDPVQMWIVTPPDFDAAKKTKYPLMQVIHGGPHTCWNDTWHWRWNMQLFAAGGYVVSAVNYHGSTGWGQNFVSSINGDLGRRELADVEAGTDHMLATGYIDPKRVVATGGSYGGYMVAYMNGNVRGDRYKAYVCHAGCFDWTAMMGSDGYPWVGLELGGFPWDNEAQALKQSPHHYAAHFATPTLVMHGELDYRVPYYQGLAYYNTLRAKDVASRLVFFPDENHWILKPQNSVLWYKEFMGWCDRYTQPKKAKGK